MIKLYTMVLSLTLLFHRRLGHASMQVIKKALVSGNIAFTKDKSNCLLICNALLLSDHHKLPYSIASPKVVKPLQLISLNVWAYLFLMLIPSIQCSFHINLF